MTISEESVQFKRAQLALALGEAVSRWVNVEFAIVALFSISAKIEPALGAAILRNAKSFSLILDICDSAIRHALKGKPQLVHWRSLLDYTRELSSDRNYIAHHAMVLHAPGPPDSIDPKLVKPMIGPNILAAMAGDTQKRQAVDHHEVTEMCSDFQFLIEALHRFTAWFQLENRSEHEFIDAVVRRRPSRHHRKKT